MKATETQRRNFIDEIIVESYKYKINVAYSSHKYDGTQVSHGEADRTIFTFKKNHRDFEYVVDWNRGIRDERSLIRYIIDKALAYFGYARGAGTPIWGIIPTLEIDLSKHIDKIIFNPPATIVLWKDKTKTVVKADGEDYDPEKGMAMAFSRKLLGGRGSYYNVFKHWLRKWDEEHSTVFKKVLLTSEDVIAPWKGIDLPKLELDLTKLKEFTSTINNPIPDIQQAMYDKIKEGGEETRKHDLIQKAYNLLIETRDNLDECCRIPIDESVDLDTVIGYLGEYLDD